MDKISLTKLNLLHPKVRPHAIAAFGEAELALSGKAKPRITSTLRTFEEQTKLYNQGRTTPGQKVTNAKAGQSNHNFATALDFALIVDTNKDGIYDQTSWETNQDYDGDKVADWLEVVHIFKKYGFKWGGDWVTFKDMPHLEYPTGLTLTQMLAKYNKGDFIPGTKFINF